MEHSITYVGLDVHKDTIAVAAAKPGKRGEVREYGKIANTPVAVRALIEAGPCGYGIQRQLTAAGQLAERAPLRARCPLLGKAGGMVTARRTLATTISRIPSDAGS